MRNNVALRISDKRGSKRPKKPQNRLFLLGVAVQSDLRGGSMSPRLFLQQNTAKPRILSSLSIAVFLRSWAWLAYLIGFRSQAGTQGFLAAHTGLFTAERKRRLSGAFAIVDWIRSARQWHLLYLSSFLLVILLLSLIFLWIRISEATPKEFLHYSKRETRWYILLVLEPFSR